MKRFLAIVAFFGAFLGASAQRQMKDFILTMPDSLVKYLNTTKRTEMVDFYFMGVKAETFNLLSEGTVLDSLTANHADIRLNESARMQLHLLPRENGDTVVCMVRTFLGEAPESTFAFYDSNWKSLERKGFLPEVDPMSLIHRPDTMTVERYEELLRLVDPLMVAAEITPADGALTFSLSTPMTTKKEREALQDILVQRKLKWDGKSFN